LILLVLFQALEEIAAPLPMLGRILSKGWKNSFASGQMGGGSLFSGFIERGR